MLISANITLILKYHSMTESISQQTARHIILEHHLLDSPNRFSGKEGVLTCLQHLGYIQIDTISVIERAHHHTLWTRVPDYSPVMLHELQAHDRAIFEYWGHAMSYVPMTDYRFFLPLKKSFDHPTHPWFKQRQKDYGEYTSFVLDRIKKEGPLKSADFERHPNDKSGPWFEHKVAKGALELLFWRGELMVKERQNFNKVYDLTERVLPENLNLTYPSKDEWAQFFIMRALQSQGVAREKDIIDHMETVDKKFLAKRVKDMAQDGKIETFNIEGLEENYYALPESLNSSNNKESNVHILSHFDNAAISRDRLKRLFHFNYTLECYVPPAKRTFGYFALPVLFGDDFVGKIDAKANRSQRTLLINNFIMDHIIKHQDDFFAKLARKLLDFSQFNGCNSIRFLKTDEPSKTLARFIKHESSRFPE